MIRFNTIQHIHILPLLYSLLMSRITLPRIEDYRVRPTLDGRNYCQLCRCVVPGPPNQDNAHESGRRHLGNFQTIFAEKQQQQLLKLSEEHIEACQRITKYSPWIIEMKAKLFDNITVPSYKRKLDFKHELNQLRRKETRALVLTIILHHLLHLKPCARMTREKRIHMLAITRGGLLASLIAPFLK